MRKEKDALGTVMVPEDKYYGAQTQRAYENFKIDRNISQRVLSARMQSLKKRLAG